MLEEIKSLLWSPVTVINLALLGTVVLFKSRFFVIRNLFKIFKDTIFSVRKNPHSFSLMCTSLGGTIGVGNAIGVAGAIVEGGAGAVFWMAIAGFFGMAIKWVEILFCEKYKRPLSKSSGPLSYIEFGIGSRMVSLIYAFFGVLVSFGMGNLSQVKSALLSFKGVLPFKEVALSILIAILFLWVTIGGFEKISSFSKFAVPFVSLLYLSLLTLILIKFAKGIPSAFSGILSGSGIFFGIKWAIIKRGLTGGFSKAIFSSEAGLGSVGFAHSASTISPEDEAKWGVVEVGIDAFICIMTSVAILSSPIDLNTAMPSFITRAVFYISFGKIGEFFYAFSMLLFAFSSLLCWYYNGMCCVSYITDKKSVKVFYLASFTFLIFLSAFLGDSVIIDLSDIANALMMIINLSCLWVLVGKNSLTF